MKSIKLLAVLTVIFIVAITASACSKQAYIIRTADDPSTAYYINDCYGVVLPENTDMLFSIMEGPSLASGRRARYNIFLLENEPTEILNSFIKKNEDYPDSSDQVYVVDAFSDTKSKQLEYMFSVHDSGTYGMGLFQGNLPEEFRPDLNDKYLWKMTDSPHDGLCIMYFPNSMRLVIYERGH